MPIVAIPSATLWRNNAGEPLSMKLPHPMTQGYTPPFPETDDDAPAERLLWQIARVADGIARDLHRPHADPVSDLEVWERAEREILGDTPASVGTAGE